MATDTHTKPRRSKAPLVDARQLGLFEAPPNQAPAPAAEAPPRGPPSPPPPPPHAAKPPNARASAAQASQRNPRQTMHTSAIRTVRVEDLPNYPPDLVSRVEAQVKTIPTDRVLLTYREIQDYFGISRATTIRRLKEELVPGIRIANGRVLDEGPVRRLDRTQVRWLLLAVNHGRAG